MQRPREHHDIQHLVIQVSTMEEDAPQVEDSIRRNKLLCEELENSIANLQQDQLRMQANIDRYTRDVQGLENGTARIVGATRMYNHGLLQSRGGTIVHN